MKFSSNEAAPIASASTIENSPATQSSIGFLSLPLEIRLMVYDHLFVPEKDGTCRPVQYSHLNHRLEGCRVPCRDCAADRSHIVCEPKYHEMPVHFKPALVIANGFMHTSILWTCKTIYREAPSSLLAHMNLSVFYYHSRPDLGSSQITLKRLLDQLQLSNTPWLPNLRLHVARPLNLNPGSVTPVTDLNDVRARVGNLNLQTFGDEWDKLKLELVEILLSFATLPLSVEWVDRYPTFATAHSISIIKKFNTAANKWLKASRNLKNTGTQVSLIEMLSQPIDHE